MNFDFDEWVALFQQDPEEAERRRRAVTEDLISSVASEGQERLRRLQWRIDRERERHTSPLGSCVALNQMLMERVYNTGGFFESVKLLGLIALDRGEIITIEPKKNCRFLTFPK
ncbi:MAG: hypothetical protein A2878_02900 [Candidatus Moranbacteria bacterium RIFCSPHIGHO2_01_FULL_54_31]|nr:MAG: hypothetical protein A2878_02900 [Candidatus Moranbacteria bacterium RIFCSPHIGHO2_01_FULL_54_31]